MPKAKKTGPDEGGNLSVSDKAKMIAVHNEAMSQHV